MFLATRSLSLFLSLAAAVASVSCNPSTGSSSVDRAASTPHPVQPTPTPELPPTASPSPGRMVALPGATFKMKYGALRKATDAGAAAARRWRSQDPVTVKAFLLDVTEVTANAYRACVEAGACTAPGPGVGRTYDALGLGEHPVNFVDWPQATAYCAWAKKRLPTDEEWEWAARGGSRATEYPWGNEPPSDQLCWNGVGSELGKGKRHATCAVGSYPKGDTPEGIHDLAGSVWEWTSADYDVPEPNVRVAQTPEEAALSIRVVRGGSWHDEFIAGLGDREGFGSWNRQNDLGFRCAKTP